MSTRLHIVMPDGMVERLDAARHTPVGRVSRTAFVLDAVELAIRRVEQAGALAVGEPEALAVHRQVVSSGWAKRDVVPIPKGDR